MQTGKDDRHVPERLRKTSTPLQNKGILAKLLKPRVLILVLVVLLLMLIFVMSLSVDKNDATANSASTKNQQRKEQTKKQPKQTKKEKSPESSVSQEVQSASATATEQQATSVSDSISSPKGAPIARKASENQYETGKKQTEIAPPIQQTTSLDASEKKNSAEEKNPAATVVVDEKNADADKENALKTQVDKSDASKSTSAKTEAAKFDVIEEKQPQSVEKNEKAEDKQETLNKAASANKKEDKKPAANSKKEKAQSQVNSQLGHKQLIANDRFSIQLVGSTSLENVRKLVVQYNIKNGHIYETIRNNKSWYVLIQGDYPSIEAARDAIKLLPTEFQQNQAWVKAGVKINKEMALVPNQPN